MRLQASCTVYYFLLTPVNSGRRFQCCRCRPPRKNEAKKLKTSRTTAKRKSKLSNSSLRAAKKIHVPYLGHIGALLHDLPVIFCFHRQRYQYGFPPAPLSPPPPFSFSPLFLASSFACRNQLFSTSAQCHLAMKPSAALTIPRNHLSSPLAIPPPLSRTKKGKFPSIILGISTPRCRLPGIGPMSFLVNPVPGSPHRPSSRTSPIGLVAQVLPAVRPPDILLCW